ncbi:hypothetical protein K439DRAFT_1339526 [Ramaria rubella]|nr:hypothetical protein K439DRAFT_1339526 [Ramaria rubella]
MPGCSSFLCSGREGTLLCSKCKEGVPPTVYCSPECQREDWKFHKQFCGKQAYVFFVELMGSSDPPITRTVAVPAWFTFQQLHFTLQYIFGPWQNCHLPYIPIYYKCNAERWANILHQPTGASSRDFACRKILRSALGRTSVR